MKRDSEARAERHEPKASVPQPVSEGAPTSRYGGLVFVGVVVGLMLLVIAIDLLRR